MKSVASNLPDAQKFELVIIANRQIPSKIIHAVSQYFLSVTRVKPSGRVIDFSKDCSTEAILQYRDYDRWYISPDLIITSSLEESTETDIFYQTSESSLSTSIFFIKAQSVIPMALTRMIESRNSSNFSYELRSSDLQFILTNNFLAQKTIPKKRVLVSSALVDSTLDYTDTSTHLALDTRGCTGSKYSNLHNTITEILKKQKNNLPKVIKKNVISEEGSLLVSSAQLVKPSFGNFDRDPNRVSVIMTNYNCEAYLPRAIKSVLSQTHSNLELLIVDDASTDKSLEVINEFAQADSRIRVFRNLSQRGTYWAKNSVLHKTTGSYITMIDSDDYDVKDRLAKQLAEFTSPEIVCVTCLNDRKISEFSNVSEKISMGYPSMMFRYEVFERLGHYDTVRFGADSEFYDRVRIEYGPRRIKRVNEVLQISPRRTNGLTRVIPELSQLRVEYLKSYTKWHNSTTQRYLEFPQKTRKFPIPTMAEVAYSDLSNSVVVESKSIQTLPVIMCVWKRIGGFENTVKQLNSQTFKNFKLFVWNNNPSLSDKFLDILKTANFEYEFHESLENIGGFARFVYAKKIRRNPGLMNYCVFIDDDQEFGPELLATFLAEAEPNTIRSQWGWEFTKLQYYGNDARRQRLPGESIHYAGTGGMVVDMRVFDSEGLFDCPEPYWFVEDLWLSFYANHVLGFKLLKSAAVMKNGDDIHSLYRVVKDVKTPMLIDLVTNYGWNILNLETDPNLTSTPTHTVNTNQETIGQPGIIDVAVNSGEPSNSITNSTPEPLIEIEQSPQLKNKFVQLLSKIIKI